MTAHFIGKVSDRTTNQAIHLCVCVFNSFIHFHSSVERMQCVRQAVSIDVWILHAIELNLTIYSIYVDCKSNFNKKFHSNDLPPSIILLLLVFLFLI